MLHKHPLRAIPAPAKKIAMVAFCFLGFASSSQAVSVAIAGFIDAANPDATKRNKPIVDFVMANFSNVTSITQIFDTFDATQVTPANIPAGTDVLIIGRGLGSGAYANAVNSLAFNNLSMPIVALTSFVTRNTGDRWGWHAGAEASGGPVTGSETTITADGASLFGVAAGTADWWSGSVTFSSAGALSGAIGGAGTGGTILATIGGQLLTVGWDAGDTYGAGTNTFGGPRLLFNIPESGGSGSPAFVPDTAAGIAAFRSAIDAYTPLTAVPEPSGSLMLLGSFGLMALRRRRKA